MDKRGLRDCQYHAETEFEKALKAGEKKSLPVPLAPINVQKRVISRIEEMFALLEE
ncbi:MAG: hypothetical protein K5654_05440 [Lachnospiraceae bacterium]|nr:hypothetical protein [Lachnospiraceae bacterium]